MPLSGALTLKKNYHRGVGGELSFSGALQQSTGLKKAVGGALSFAGDVVARLKNNHKAVGGILSFSGALQKAAAFKRSVGGVLSFSGNLTAFAGFINVAGILGALSGLLTMKKNGVPIGIGGVGKIILGKIKGIFLSKDIFL